MFRQFLFLLLICFTSLAAFAQTVKYTVPVKWERYKVSDKEVSVLLPKLPVAVDGYDVCNEQETRRYATYADQTVYGFTVISKRKEKKSDYCTQKKNFDAKSFLNRLTELKTELKEFTESNFKQNNLTVNKISGKITTYWLINDFDNKRWFELWTTGRDDEKTDIQNFVKSIEIGKKAQGIEIGNGADRAYGDETTKVEQSKDGDTSAIIVAFKPSPKYTEAARQASIQGTIALRVTFNSSGGVGSITPVNSLPYGLTEQAILAAQRLVFIPPKRNGISYSVSKSILYTFSIY